MYKRQIPYFDFVVPTELPGVDPKILDPRDTYECAWDVYKRQQYVSPINLRASGYIDKIYFTEHQEVHKGDTLLVLDDREYKIRVMEAEACLLYTSKQAL